MIAILFFLVTIVLLGAAVYLYFRREQDKWIPKKTDEEHIRHVTEAPDHFPYPSLVGLGVAGVHFVIAYVLKASGFASFGYIVSSILTAPSYVLSSIVDYLLWSYITDKVIIVAWASFTFPYIFTSSLFYGAVGGLLASRKAKLRFLGIAFIFICLLGFIGICLMALAAQSFA